MTFYDFLLYLTLNSEKYLIINLYKKSIKFGGILNAISICSLKIFFKRILSFIKFKSYSFHFLDYLLLINLLMVLYMVIYPYKSQLLFLFTFWFVFIFIILVFICSTSIPFKDYSNYIAQDRQSELDSGNAESSVYSHLKHLKTSAVGLSVGLLHQAHGTPRFVSMTTKPGIEHSGHRFCIFFTRSLVALAMFCMRVRFLCARISVSIYIFS